jgi:IS1 family transposase
VVAWTAGPREAALAEQVVQTTRQRTADQAGVPWVSDGWEPYGETINQVYRDPEPAGRPGWERLVVTAGTSLTQVVKHRQGRRLVRAEVRATIGPAAEQPYTVHVERFNGVLRDRLSCLTRKTHAFAKTDATGDAAVSLALFEHNWLHPHGALRQRLATPEHGRRYRQRTPAMAIGLTDHPWTLREFLTHPKSQCS